MRPDEPKRLEPTKETLRELLLFSGNRCAFPDCDAALLDRDGKFIAQLCHIEAALSGGERFNALMTNEQRRSAANLTFMCYPHHVTTNDVERYSVERLRELKARHEANYAQAAERILEAEYKDRRTEHPTPAVGSLEKYGRALSLSPEDITKFNIYDDLTAYRNRLAELPREERQLLLVAARLLKKGEVTFSELRKVTRVSTDAIAESLRLLQKHRFLDADSDFGDPPIFHLRAQSIKGGLSNEEHVDSLIATCESEGLDPEQVIVDLRFDLL